MLNDDELRWAFWLGINIFSAGAFLTIVAAVFIYARENFPQIFEWFLIGSLTLLVAGIALTGAVIFMVFLDVITSKETNKPKLKDSIGGCRSCKYFHGIEGVYCSVHPYGRSFEECNDYSKK